MDEIIEPTAPIPAPVPTPVPELVLSTEAKYYLHTAGRWATFLGIMGFIGTGVLLLCAIFIGTFFSAISHLTPATADVPSPAAAFGAASGFMSFIYVLIAVFYFFMSYFIYRFGTGIKKSILLNDSIGAAKSFEYLKSHLKLIGITTIVCISIELLAFIGVLIAVVFAASAVK